jgi:tape measure domain-containing protein
MSAESELAFVARLRDEASSTAAKVKRNLAAVGGDTRAEVRVSAKDEASRSLAGVERSLGRVHGAAGKVMGALGALRGPAGIAGAALGAMGALGLRAGLQTAAGMEGAKIAFGTMLGSGKKADAFLRDLSAFAAKTPFEFPELQTAASSLISAGIDAKKVIPIMTTLGDVTSGMGTGSEGVQRATVALQQMSAAGKITGEDLNQLRDAGIPVFDLLAAATGKSKAQVVALAQAGKLGAKDLASLMGALETGKGLERFSGLMEKQSASLSGQWSTLKDTANLALAGMVTPIIPSLKAGMASVSGVIASAGPAITSGLGKIKDGISSLLSGDLENASTVFAQAFGGGAGASSLLFEALDKVRGVAKDAADVFEQSIAPALSTLADEAKIFLGPLALIRSGLGLAADHGEATRVVLVALGSALLFARTSMLAVTAVSKTAAAAQYAYSLATGRAASAEGLATRAKIAGAAQTVKSAAITVASGIRTAAVSAATAVRVVAGWVLMGAQSLLAAARMAAAWVIAMGPIGWAIAAVVAVVAVIVTHWQQVKDMTVAAWKAVAGAVTGAWDAITGAVSAAVSAVTGFLSAHWPLILAILTGPFGLAVLWISRHWDSIKSAVSKGVASVVSFVSGLPGKVAGALSSLGSKLWHVVSGAFVQFLDAERRGITEAVRVIGGVGGWLLQGLGNVGDLLLDAGRKIIEGLVRGITNSAHLVKDALGKITGKLTSWKGPPSTDAKILRPAGGLIIGGLVDGIRASTPEVRKALADTTAAVQRYGSATGSLSLAPVSVTRSSGQVVTIKHDVAFVGPSPAGLSARDVADLIARDPRAAAGLEAALAPARGRARASTLLASR